MKLNNHNKTINLTCEIYNKFRQSHQGKREWMYRPEAGVIALVGESSTHTIKEVKKNNYGNN